MEFLEKNHILINEAALNFMKYSFFLQAVNNIIQT